MSKKTKEIKISVLLYSFLAIIAGYFLVVVVMLYGFGVENSFIKKTLKFFPFPAAILGSGSYISIGELESELVAVKNFYENQDFSNIGYRVDFSTEEGSKRLMIKKRRLLNKLIEDKIIERLSKERGIKIDDEIISHEIDSNIEKYGDKEEVLSKVKELYDWDLNDFKEKIIKPEMYRKNLSENVRESDADILASKKKADEALVELGKGKNFAEVVSQYSEGESAKEGGELGWLSIEQMIPEIALTAGLLEKGKTSNVLETPLGFHIIMLEDKKTENNTDMFKVKQIFVRAKNFSDWLLEQEKNIKIYVPLKDFYWDREAQAVKFSDRNLEDFENKLDENSSGDISVIF